MPKTNHRTLIDGVGYKITGGRAKVGGATYNIKNGRTKVANVAYNINFMQPVNNTATAQLYSDGSLVFQWDDWRDPTKTWKASYTGWICRCHQCLQIRSIFLYFSFKHSFLYNLHHKQR